MAERKKNTPRIKTEPEQIEIKPMEDPIELPLAVLPQVPVVVETEVIPPVPSTMKKPRKAINPENAIAKVKLLRHEHKLAKEEIEELKKKLEEYVPKPPTQPPLPVPVLVQEQKENKKEIAVLKAKIEVHEPSPVVKSDLQLSNERKMKQLYLSRRR